MLESGKESSSFILIYKLYCRDPSLREHVARILQWHMTRIVIQVTLIRIFL